MGFWKDRADEFTGRDKPPAKTENKPQSKGRMSAGARGTVYDSNGKLRTVPIEDVLDEQGRFRKGRR